MSRFRVQVPRGKAAPVALPPGASANRGSPRVALRSAQAMEKSPHGAPVVGPSRRLLALLSVVVIAVALGGYAVTGSPSLIGAGGPSEPAARGTQVGAGPAASTSPEQISEVAKHLAASLKDQPQDAQGWATLGRAYTVLGRNDEAVKAYATAVSLHDADAALLADYASALAVKNNRTLAGEPMKWVRRALEVDPNNLKALALAGSDAFVRSDFAGAVKVWERLLALGPADENFVQQVEANLAEARARGGLGAAAPRVATSPPATGADVNGAKVSGTVSLNAALVAQAGPDDTVFIFARAAEGSRMPLAVLRKRVRELPIRFTLDDSLAMSPAAKLSGAARVIVGARISKSGNATPSPGDLIGQIGPVPMGSDGLSLEIRERIKP